MTKQKNPPRVTQEIKTDEKFALQAPQAPQVQRERRTFTPREGEEAFMQADRDSIRQYIMAWYWDSRNEDEGLPEFFERMAAKKGLFNPYEAEKKEREEKEVYVRAMAAKAGSTPDAWLATVASLGMKVAKGAGGRFCVV